MAEPQRAAAPQAFTFGSLQLMGFLEKFTGNSKRRFVVHEFPKRPGARVEDMERGPRRMEAAIVFTGDHCAADYARFDAAVHENPRRLLTHPIAGQWLAFCEGPTEDVDFSHATDQIRVRVAWTETELDAVVTAGEETTDVATAQQEATATLSGADQTLARYAGELAKASTAIAAARNAVDGALAQVGLVTSSLDLLHQTIASVSAIPGTVLAVVASLAKKFTALSGHVQNYVDAAADLYDGTESTATATTTATQLGTVEAAALDLEADLMASSPTPAGAADAVGAIEETLASCYVLDAALRAARPPTILYTVPELIGLVELVQRRYQKDAIARAVEIQAMNHILNPAAIPAGTRLWIPSR